MVYPLVKNFGAAVLGYVVMFAVAFVLFSLTWAVLGADGSFAPGVWLVSSAWIGASIVLGLLVSISGGYTCWKLASSQQAVAILALLVIVMAVLSAVPDGDATSVTRPEGATMFDAMSSAEQPTWLLWINPALGVVGVLAGARLATARQRPGLG